MRWATGLLLCACACSEASSTSPKSRSDAGELDATTDAATTSDAPALDALLADAGLEPTEPTSLTSGPGKNEDPTVYMGLDGNYRIGFFSDRSGNDDIWIASSDDAKSWSAPVDTTTAPEHDFYPSGILGDDGQVHMVWFRAEAGTGTNIVGSIWYRSGTDDATWSTPKALTGSAELNWAPTVAQTADGKLWVAWGADRNPTDKDVFLVSSADGGKTWSDPPTQVTDASANDDFPFVLARPDGSLFLVWVRYAIGETSPLGGSSGEIVYATSQDGTSWSKPLPITDDSAGTPFADTLPCAFESHDGSGVSVAWTSSRDDPFGELYAIGLSEAPNPAKSTRLTTSPGKDYSPRLIKTSTPKIYLFAWVSNRNGPIDADDLDIFHQLIALP